LASKPVCYNMLLKVYQMALQRSAGKGEILVSLISSDAQKAKKHGDINISGKNVEMKSDLATIHQEEENKFRIIDKLNSLTFGKTAKQAAKEFKAYHPLPTLLSDAKGAREFYSKVYRNWGEKQLDTIERVWDETTCANRRSMELGYLVMLDYVRHKGIDSLLLTELNEKTNTICAVNISDFSDKNFIFDNVVMKPQKHRGGSTESRPDGLVNIGVRKTTR
jgi:hypothetical protein